jgi:pheromone shutdown protein TraB
MEKRIVYIQVKMSIFDLDNHMNRLSYGFILSVILIFIILIIIYLEAEFIANLILGWF